MTQSIGDILRDFSEVQGTASEKLGWLRGRLHAFSEELAAEIEGRVIEDPTFVGRQYNAALQEAAAIVRRTTGPLPR